VGAGHDDYFDPEVAVHDLAHFTSDDAAECSATIRDAGAGANSLEEVATRIVRFLRSDLTSAGLQPPKPPKPASAAPSPVPPAALVRCFVTVPYGELDTDLQAFARGMLGTVAPTPEMKCLTLLASAGDLPDWNGRLGSRRHRALPLASEQNALRSPMIAQLMEQFGLELGSVVTPDAEILLGAKTRQLGVFHVAEAPGSPFIPAQRDFVIPFGIRSVVGFGGLFPSGDFFAFVIFARCVIPRETAELLGQLSLSAQSALLPFAEGRRFA
jgi:hypothetical protein